MTSGTCISTSRDPATYSEQFILRRVVPYIQKFHPNKPFSERVFRLFFSSAFALLAESFQYFLDKPPSCFPTDLGKVEASLLAG